MGSQFVDLNSDGHTDYLTATFDGSVHVAYGSAKGFTTPVLLMDAQNRRLMISSIWDYDEEKHLERWHAMPEGNKAEERCISALAFDWDADGDYDLLLGSYENGSLYRQMNEGSNKAPKFTGKNIPVMAGKAAWAIPAKMTSIRLVDWNADGMLDLVAGSFGDSWSRGGAGGGVYLSLNTGEEGKPRFSALQPLIEPATGAATKPHPFSGLYPEVVDHDGDGDLDLVVGGYAIWTPKGRELTEKEQKTVQSLQAKRAKVSERMSELFEIRAAARAKVSAEFERSDPGYRQAMTKAMAPTEQEYSDSRRAMTTLGEAIAEYVPSQQRKSFVWLYERL